MGLDTTWKTILRARYPEAWLLEVPPDGLPTVVIDDLTLNIYSAVYGGSTKGLDFVEWLKSRILSKWNPDLREIILLFDESEFGPKNKQETQQKRSESSKSKPFNDKEIKTYNVMISDGLLPDMGRFMNTRPLIPQLNEYLTENLLKFKFENQMTGIRMVVDGGREGTEMLGGQKYLEPKIFIKTFGQGNTFRCDTSRIGESDVKIPKYIAKHISEQKEGSVIYVRSKDTDLIAILLLNVRDWIDRDTGNVMHTIYLDTSVKDRRSFTKKKPAKKQKKGSKSGEKEDEEEEEVREIIDVVMLWRLIIRDFNINYPSIKEPIETMVLLMFLCGTDFLESFFNIKSKTIWNVFENDGFVLFNDVEPVMTVDVENVGDPGQHHSVVLAEHILYRWFVYLFYTLAFGPPKDFSVFSLFITGPKEPPVTVTMTRVREKLTPNGNKRKYEDLDNPDNPADTVAAPDKKKDRYVIPDDAHLIAMIRRISWNFDYWMNGFKQQGFKDPVSMHPISKLPLHGWMESFIPDAADPSKRRKIVVKAPVVHKDEAP